MAQSGHWLFAKCLLFAESRHSSIECYGTLDERFFRFAPKAAASESRLLPPERTFSPRGSTLIDHIRDLATGIGYSVRLANDAATARARSIKSLPTGGSSLFFKMTIATGVGSIGR
jgi:hypothetical protein